MCFFLLCALFLLTILDFCPLREKKVRSFESEFVFRIQPCAIPYLFYTLPLLGGSFQETLLRTCTCKLARTTVPM